MVVGAYPVLASASLLATSPWPLLNISRTASSIHAAACSLPPQRQMPLPWLCLGTGWSGVTKAVPEPHAETALGVLWEGSAGSCMDPR